MFTTREVTTMGWNRGVPTWIALGMLALLATPVTAQDSFEWDGRLELGRTLRVQGISGEIRAVTAAGTQAEVRAEKRGRSSDFDAVHILVEEDRAGITICAVYRVRDPQSCDAGNGDEEWGDRSIDVSVDFEVAVPAGVDFEGVLVSGEVVAEDLRSDVRATTVSGDIVVSTSEAGEARSVSGSIEVRMGSSDFSDLQFQTVSGDITVHLSSSADAEVDFASLSGDFESDLPLAIERQRSRFVGSTLEGRLGAGGPQLSFKTVSGDVTLRTASR